MSIAMMAASRATCLRRKVGSVLVQDHSIRGTGYNGAPRGLKSCQEEGECLLTDSGNCSRCVHAEPNLILQTDARERQGATVYLTDCPCWNCALLLANSGIHEIVFLREYPETQQKVLALMQECGIVLRQYKPESSADLDPEAAKQTLGAVIQNPAR